MPKSSFPSNTQIAQLLREVSSAYEATGQDKFKSIAYSKAAISVERTQEALRNIWERGELEQLSGVGKSIAKHLDEYFRTGRVKHFEFVKKDLPEGMFELLRVPGIGGKTAHILATKLRLDGNAIVNLKKACLAGKVADLEGFGERSQEELLEGIEELGRRTDRMLLSSAWDLVDDLLEFVGKIQGVLQAEPLGSFRRRVTTIGDIDIAVSCKNALFVIEEFLKYPDIQKVLWRGDIKTSVLLKNGKQVDFYTQKPESYGSLLQHLTGSKQHNIKLRVYAMDRGWSISEHGVKIKKDNSLKEFATEEDLYSFLGVDYIPPELREGTVEITTALQHKLPNLVKLEDIKGDLHMHSNWDSPSPLGEGVTSPEEMLKWAEKQGYEYMGFADHSPRATSQPVVEIEKRVGERKKLYEKAQETTSVKVLIGMELDIFADGELSLPNSILKGFDYTVASIHTSLRQSKKVMTERIIGALKNPYVTILGHPTGRLLGSREGYELDWDQVFQVCLDYGKILEINAFPTRMDLPDELVYDAVARGVKLAINTDAHELGQLENMKFGVAVARRGWCEKKNIVNTKSYNELLKVIQTKN